MRSHRACDLELKWGKLAAACAAVLGMALTAADPSFAVHPGINGKIAYTLLIDKDGPLERRAVFVEGRGQLTHPVARGENQSESDSDPGWSSDGEQLAFVRRDGLTGEQALFVIERDGTGLRQVFSTAQVDGNGNPHPFRGKPLYSPVWSPDGSLIWLVANDRAYGVDSNTGSILANGLRIQPPSSHLDAGPQGLLAVEYGAPSYFSQFSFSGSPSKLFGFELPDSSSYRIATRYSPRSYTRGGLDKIAFAAELEPESPSPDNPIRGEILSGVTNWIGSQLDLEQISPSNSVLNCPGADGAPDTYHRRFEWRDPVPSPDGRYVVALRLEYSREFDEDDTCTFVSERSLVVLRAAGGVQSILHTGDGVDDAAWQPSPAKVAVRVSDGHGRPLDGLQVELLGGPYPVPEPESIGDGTYTFPTVPPGNYLVRATLTEKEGGAFDIRHEWPDASGPVWAEREVAVDPDVGQVQLHFPLTESDALVASSLPVGIWDRLDDLAAIYYETRVFLEWIRKNLTTDTGLLVSFHAFATNSPVGPVSPGEAFYIPSGIFIGVDDSAWANRDGFNDEGPANVEWHEFTHHLVDQKVGGFYLCGERQNHAGFVNASSCDSWQEGFAMFLPSLAQGSPNYAGMTNLEHQTKAFDTRFMGQGYGLYGGWDSVEEWAVASLLWDLVDADADFGYDEVIASGGNHFPRLYADNVHLPLTELWRILTTPTLPIMGVWSLHLELTDEPAFSSIDFDLDFDGVADANAFDQVFLMHGFFPIDQDQTMTSMHRTHHYDVDYSRDRGDPRTNWRIGSTDYLPFNYGGQPIQGRTNRFNEQAAPGADLGIDVLDASGTPLRGAEVELTVEDPDSQQTIRNVLESGDGDLVHLELPLHFSHLPPADAGQLPPCDPETDRIVSVTVRGSVNGYTSSDTPQFDNCTYLQAMMGATGSPALSVVLSFPEDSIPPASTARVLTGGPTYDANGLRTFVPGEDPNGLYATNPWNVALSCLDPVSGGFASGCWRSEYSLDGGPYVGYEDEIVIVEPGTHQLTYRSIDAAGNAEASRTLTLGKLSDTEYLLPVTTLTMTSSEPVNYGYTTGSWTVSMTCVDPSSGGPGCRRSEYRINGGQVTAYQGPFVFSQPGIHRVDYRSIDFFGNHEAWRTVFLYILDPDADGDGDGLTNQMEASFGTNPFTADTDDDGISDDAELNSTGTNPVDRDSDDDGLADGVEIAGGTNPLASDTDADGLSDGSEIAAGTDPIQFDSDGDSVADGSDNCPLLANGDQRNADADPYGDVCDYEDRYSEWQLIGISGDGGSTPESLFRIDTSDASATFLMALGNGDSGEAIAFNPADGLLYHASGRIDRVWERIDPVSLTIVTSGPFPGASAGEVTAIAHQPATTKLLVVDLYSQLFWTTDAGGAAFVAQMSDDLKGLAFVGPKLYGASVYSNDLYELDQVGGGVISSVPVTLNGNPVRGMNGLATHPETGALWAVLRVSDTRHLGTIDPASGVATSVGVLPANIAGITFLPEPSYSGGLGTGVLAIVLSALRRRRGDGRQRFLRLDPRPL